MSRREVKCINKTDRYSPHDRIQAIGGVESGTRWKMSQPAAIAAIESSVHSFYVKSSVARST